MRSGFETTRLIMHSSAPTCLLAGYNAGRGRVNEWIVKYGDPRDPKIDPIDWVKRIPLSETRNYLQRVLENL